jgi:hypothetical protein
VRIESIERRLAKYEGAETDSILVDGVFMDTAIAERYRRVVDRYERIRAIDS